MRLLSRYRPSPALVISVIALFVALGGVSYGVATGSIDSREIKNNSVRGKDIRNRTITSKDVKKNGLGGTNIKESRLGKVPSAKNADNAGTLGGHAPFEYFPSSKILRVQRFTLINNQTKTLAKNGPLTLTAHCQINQTLDATPNQDRAEVLVSTTVNNVALDGNAETEVVNPNTPADDRDFATTGPTNTGEEQIEASSNRGMVLAPGGQFIATQGFFTAVNQTATGDGKCTFAGELFMN